LCTDYTEAHLELFDEGTMATSNLEFDEDEDVCSIRAASWNIAAINNNPFEYWVTNPDPSYNTLMKSVQDFIENSGSDVVISTVFSDSMFKELQCELREKEIPGVDELEHYWKGDYSQRMAIKGFLKDKTIGLKRLASMPDRITNTISLHDGSSCKRPTVINSYDGGSLESIGAWWEQWKTFVFHTPLQLATFDRSRPRPPELVCNLLCPIKRSKYPAITEEEEAVSISLQLLCLAILDAIFVHMLNEVEPLWEEVRKDLCNALIINKATNICRIIAESYSDMEIIFIQEAAAIFSQQAQSVPELSLKFALLRPWNMDDKRNQNSLILVDRQRFLLSSCVDVTSQVLDAVEGTRLAPGDLIAVSIEDTGGLRWLLASFHGDSNGMATLPVMRAIDHVASGALRGHTLLVGIDANTYSGARGALHQSVESFCRFVEERRMTTLWGVAPDASIRTTCTARTYLQTQLNKATPFHQRSDKSEQNLKDWILAYDFQVTPPPTPLAPRPA
jgi:hypothetical protein